MEGELAAGTDPQEGCSGQFILHEADCSDMDSDDDSEIEGDIPGLLSETPVEQGNTRALFQQQTLEDDSRVAQLLKRKLISPKEKLADLSPRLRSITITPPKHSAKRRLFESSCDSGIEQTGQHETEATNTEEQQVDAVEFDEGDGCREERGEGDGETVEYGPREGGGSSVVKQLMKSSNRRATLLARFKESYGLGFGELTRTFKSNKTCNPDWVVAAHGVHPTVYESMPAVLRSSCEYMLITGNCGKGGYLVLMLLRFRAHKCRVTLAKMLKDKFTIDEIQIMSEPPRVKSVPAALFWFRLALSKTAHVGGETPEWITRQTLVSHQTADNLKFDLGQMVQWAYDNDHTEESSIAYNYALLAEEDANAAAWLNTNSQAKHVKDCCTMVRLYKRAIMRSMTMSAWIYSRMKGFDDSGDWRDIVNFLRYQNIEVIVFLSAFKALLKGTPKKNCICFFGPPNTGKSMFCMSLLGFFGGRVLSFANSKSQFWMQPLVDARMALLDDATKPAWDYIDLYLRNALDGNPISLDLKHKAPTQIKCPPLLITSNLNIKHDDRWRYLFTRVQLFEFKCDFPFNDEGQPLYRLTHESWKSFFKRLWLQLDLSDQEDEGEDGEPEQTFKCGARRTS
ncbi:E1 [Canis familiaris papillomavirus 14]|uniref:Replication protein E1 n=1 Tax=Canis familiaris papillomavirus 14 TaxID=1236767 RepID=K7QIA1_9PAPI|nr:E1 [Canis familiaris papillomavirus 14]AFU07672.1 E1 [Canis familiaris papillomavirus 14]